MKRAALACGAALVLLLAAYGIYRLCLSDETRIREFVTGMAADFNAGAVGSCVDGLAADYREEIVRVRKDEVHQLLVALWFREKDPKTGEFPFRVELPPEEIRVTLDGEARDKAEIELTARFADVRRNGGKPLWQVRVEAKLAKVDGKWRVKSSRHETLEGRVPF